MLPVGEYLDSSGLSNSGRSRALAERRGSFRFRFCDTSKRHSSYRLFGSDPAAFDEVRAAAETGHIWDLTSNQQLQGSVLSLDRIRRPVEIPISPSPSIPAVRSTMSLDEQDFVVLVDDFEPGLQNAAVVVLNSRLVPNI